VSAPVIRPATPADVPALRDLAARAYAIYTPRIGRPAAPVTADYAAAVARGEVWIAADGDAIAGLIVLVAHPDHLLIENIAVRPAGQGHGLGTRLLAHADQQAARLGLRELRLYTNAAMTENISFYPRHGYALTHRAEVDGYQRVFFTRRL
jgi:ribosomal protein S18 acetylase RimI-like enzyme